MGSHIKPTACPGALGTSKVAILRDAQGRAQQPAPTSAPLPGWDQAAHVSPGTQGSSPVDYLRLRCCGRGRRARGRQSGSWSFSPGRCPPHPSSCPGRTARAHQQHPQPGCSPFVGTFGNYRFSGAKHSLIAAGAGGIDFLFCFKCS